MVLVLFSQFQVPWRQRTCLNVFGHVPWRVTQKTVGTLYLLLTVYPRLVFWLVATMMGLLACYRTPTCNGLQSIGNEVKGTNSTKHVSNSTLKSAHIWYGYTVESDMISTLKEFAGKVDSTNKWPIMPTTMLHVLRRRHKIMKNCKYGVTRTNFLEMWHLSWPYRMNRLDKWIWYSSHARQRRPSEQRHHQQTVKERSHWQEVSAGYM